MGVNWQALITGGATAADSYGQALFKYRLAELERKNRLADLLAEKRQTGIDEGSYIPAPKVQIGTTTDKLSLLPGMQDKTGLMPSYPSNIQPQATFRLGGEGYMPKPKREKWEPATKEEYLSTKEAEAGIKAKGTADASGLSSLQQTQAMSLAKKLYGVRGSEKILPSIYAQMKAGNTIDQIEDSLRYSGQSKEFSGDFRNAAQSVLINAPESQSQKAMDYMDDLYSKGDIEGAKNQLKRLARKQESKEVSDQVVGKERTIKLLDEIQSDLNNLESMGVNTNIFTGTAEDVSRKLGAVNNPELRKVATKIQTAIINYRKAMSGVAFTPKESAEYVAIFPGIGKTANFNSVNIAALKDVFGGDIDNFYSMAMGEQEYQNLFKSGQGQGKPNAAKVQQDLLKRQGNNTGDLSYLWK